MTAPANVVEGFRSHAATRPHAAAMFHWVDGNREQVTWQEAQSAADRLSSYLLTEGAGVHEHIAIWSTNRPEWHETDMAILQLRCSPVPVYQTLSAEEAAHVLGHSESRVVFVENEKILAKVRAVCDRLPALERVVVMDTATPVSDDGFVISMDEALRRGELHLDVHRDEIDARARSVDPGDVATLIYTSGTTGNPKAVFLTHANIEASMQSLETFLDVTPEDRVLSYLPLAHIAERFTSEFRSYLRGNPVYFLDDIKKLNDRLTEVRPTQFFAVPRVWEKMAQKTQAEMANRGSLERRVATHALKVGRKVAERKQSGRKPGPLLLARYKVADKVVLGKARAALGFDQATMVASGAAPIDTEVLLFFASLGLEICEVYGQTEDCGLTTMNRPGSSRIGTVGQTLPNIEVTIAEDGEILVRGDNVFGGYYRDRAATEDTLVDGWLYTGDLGKFDSNGYLQITGRKKDIIITAGGKNITPTNIENEIRRLDIVSQAVAIGDRRPFISALITLDPELKSRWQGPDGRVSDEAMQRIAAHMAGVNKDLSQVEQVKKWTVLTQDFQLGDELTPTLKVKRNVVARKYARQIDGMY